MTDSYLLVASVYLLNEQIMMSNNEILFPESEKEPTTLHCMLLNPFNEHMPSNTGFTLLIYSSKEELGDKAHDHRKCTWRNQSTPVSTNRTK